MNESDIGEALYLPVLPLSDHDKLLAQRVHSVTLETRMGIEEFSPGFRLSARDMSFLVVGFTAATALAWVDSSLSLMIGLPLAHFFLFCNVFRVSRPLELLWTGVYLSLAGATTVCGTPGWWSTIALSLGVSVLVVVVEMRKPSYHGLGWQRINPRLRDWWKGNGVQVKESGGTADDGSRLDS